MLVANLFENVHNYSNHLLIIVKYGFRMNKAVRSLKFITLKEITCIVATIINNI